MQKCTYPGCDHAGEVITNYHTINQHGMKKEEVKEMYGEFECKKIPLNSDVVRWIKESSFVSPLNNLENI